MGRLHLLAERRRFHQEKIEELTNLLQEQEKKLAQLAERKASLLVQVESGDEEKARIHRAVREKEEELRGKEERILETRRYLEEKKTLLSRFLQDLTRIKQEINTVEVHNGVRRERSKRQGKFGELTAELAEQTGKKPRSGGDHPARQEKPLLKKRKESPGGTGKTHNHLEAQARKNQEIRINPGA